MVTAVSRAMRYSSVAWLRLLCITCLSRHDLNDFMITGMGRMAIEEMTWSKYIEGKLLLNQYLIKLPVL